MDCFPQMLDIRAPWSPSDSKSETEQTAQKWVFIYSLIYRLCVIHGSIGEPGGNDPWLQNDMLDILQDLRAAPKNKKKRDTVLHTCSVTFHSSMIQHQWFDDLEVYRDRTSPTSSSLTGLFAYSAFLGAVSRYVDQFSKIGHEFCTRPMIWAQSLRYDGW